MYTLNHNILSQVQSDDKVFVVNLSDPSFSYVSIDGIASRLFLAIEQERDLESVQDEILAEFDVERDRLSEDLDKFLEFLLLHELIRKA